MAQLWDMLNNLGIARAGNGSETDGDPRYLRGRIATILWFPGGVLCLVAGAASGSVWVGIGSLALLITGLWLFAFRPGATMAFLRRLFRRP